MILATASQKKERRSHSSSILKTCYVALYLSLKKVSADLEQIKIRKLRKKVFIKVFQFVTTYVLSKIMYRLHAFKMLSWDTLRFNYFSLHLYDESLRVFSSLPCVNKTSNTISEQIFHATELFTIWTWYTTNKTKS